MCQQTVCSFLIRYCKFLAFILSRFGFKNKALFQWCHIFFLLSRSFYFFNLLAKIPQNNNYLLCYIINVKILTFFFFFEHSFLTYFSKEIFPCFQIFYHMVELNLYNLYINTEILYVQILIIDCAFTSNWYFFFFLELFTASYLCARGMCDSSVYLVTRY